MCKIYVGGRAPPPLYPALWSNLKTLSKVLYISNKDIVCHWLDVPKKDLFHLPVGTGEKTTLQCGEVLYSYAIGRIPVLNCVLTVLLVLIIGFLELLAGSFLVSWRYIVLSNQSINDTPNDVLLNRMRKYPYRHIMISFPSGICG